MPLFVGWIKTGNQQFSPCCRALAQINSSTTQSSARATKLQHGPRRRCFECFPWPFVDWMAQLTASVKTNESLVFALARKHVVEFLQYFVQVLALFSELQELGFADIIHYDAAIGACDKAGDGSKHWNICRRQRSTGYSQIPLHISLHSVPVGTLRNGRRPCSCLSLLSNNVRWPPWTVFSVPAMGLLAFWNLKSRASPQFRLLKVAKWSQRPRRGQLQRSDHCSGESSGMGAVPGSLESHGQGSGGAKSQSDFFFPCRRDRNPGRWR